MVRSCNLAEVEEDGVASLCVGSMRDCIVPYARCPWWLYICSQLGLQVFLPSTPSQSAGPCGLHLSFERASSLAGIG
jgi:hypothetical protein